MLVADFNWLLQFVVFASSAVLGFLCLLQNTSSRFFEVDSNFGSPAADISLNGNIREEMAAAAGGAAEVSDPCAVCGLFTTKQCGGCKMVKCWYTLTTFLCNASFCFVCICACNCVRF